MTVLRRGDLEVFVPPVIQFQGYGHAEAFNIPLTALNIGARSSTILSITLEVRNPRLKQTKLYYPDAIGSFKDRFRDDVYPFSPIAIAGRRSRTVQLIFERRPGQDDTPEQRENNIRHIDNEGGVYEFRLGLSTVSAGKQTVETIQFKMDFGRRLDYRHFNNGGSLPMYDVKMIAPSRINPADRSAASAAE